MRLDAQDLFALHQALTQAYSLAAFKMLVSFPPVMRDLENIAAPGTKEERFFEALDAANRENWIGDVIAALAANPDNRNAELIALTERLNGGAQPAAGAEAHKALLLGSRVFVDRDDLRNDIARTGQGDPFGPKVYLIRGGAASGKSYCYWLAQFIGKQVAGAQIAFFDIDTGGTAANAIDVVASLAAQMGMPDPPPIRDDPQPATRARKSKDWFIGQARRLPGVWWIVIDSLDMETANASVLDLIGGLAEAVERGILENLRFFLLGFTAQLPPDVEMQVAHVDLQPIAEPDVRIYLETLKRNLGLPPDMATVDDAIAFCFEALPAPPRGHDELMRMVSRLSVIARSAAQGG